MSTQPEFDRYASDYSNLLKDPLRDRFAPGLFFHERKWLLIRDFFQRAKLDTNRLRWLDVGCGKGELLSFGRSSFGQVVGCDPSAEMLAHTKELEVRHQPDTSTLPLRGETFDFVTAVCVYHHVALKQRPDLTRAVAAGLSKGGLFCIIEHNPFNPLTQLIVRRSPVDANVELLLAREAARLCRGAGLNLIRSEYFLYFPEPIYRAFPHERWLSRLPLGGQYAVFAQKP